MEDRKTWFEKQFFSLQDLQVGEPERKATPEDLIHATKGVTLATAKAVAAGNSGKQEDIVQAANVGQRYCTELLVVVKVSAGRLNFSEIKDNPQQYRTLVCYLHG